MKPYLLFYTNNVPSGSAGGAGVFSLLLSYAPSLADGSIGFRACKAL